MQRDMDKVELSTRRTQCGDRRGQGVQKPNNVCGRIIGDAAISRARCPRYRSAQLRAVAAAPQAEGVYGLLAMQAAPSQGIDKYMQLGARAGLERAAAHTQLQAAIQAAAQLLARLHTQIGGGPVRPASAAIERFCTSLHDITAKLVQHEHTLVLGALDARRLQERSAELIAAVQQQPGPAALAHNDAHPGNIFYDPQQGATLIGLASMHQSMNARGMPIGIAARDTAYFAHTLAYFGPGWGMTAAELGEFQTVFQLGIALPKDDSI